MPDIYIQPSSEERRLTFISSRVLFGDFGISDPHPPNKCLAIVGMSIVLFFLLPSVQISKQVRSARKGHTSVCEVKVVTTHQRLRGASGVSSRECSEYYAAALSGFVAILCRGGHLDDLLSIMRLLCSDLSLC